MAVEIPVVIDVDKAFKDAAARIPQLMKPLKASMDENALAIQLKIDQSGNKYLVKDILDDANLSAKQLNIALADINAKIKSRADAGGFDLSKGLAKSEKMFLQVAGALENKLHGVTDASAIMSRVYAINIGRARKKIQELSAELDTLTRKQNFNVKKISETEFAPKGTGATYEKTKAKIEAVNKELLATRNYLGQLTAGLANVRGSADGASGSVAKMSSYARQMADEWRRGQAYVERWNASLGTANNRLAMLIKNSVYLVSLHSAARFVHNIREVTAEFEMQRVALGGIIQDTEQAEQLFKRIKAAAIKSPFEIKDLVTFTKQLSAYRIETENLFDVTMRLADISAGLGVDMNRLVLAYGQVRAASVLRGQELRQFTEAGIPLVELLAEKFKELGREGTTTADVFELISKRAVPFSMIEEIFNDMTDAGGMFYKMQEKQSETLKGQWMKLKDALSIMYDEIGNTDAVHGAMETLIKQAMQMLQNWREVAKTIKIAVATFVAYKVALTNASIAANALTLREAASVSALQLNVVGRSRLIASLLGEKKATEAAIFAGNQYVRMKKREMVATNMFTKSLYRMLAALWKNPYAIAIAGATILIGSFIRIIKSAKEAAFSIEDFQKAIESTHTANEHERDIKRLCDKYDELSAKTDKTAKEQAELGRVSRELAKAFPSAVSGVSEYGDAVEINTEKVRLMSEAEAELLRNILERKKAEAEAELGDLTKRREEINKILKEGGYTVLGGTEEAPELEFHALDEEDTRRLGEELAGIIKRVQELGGEIRNADTELQGFIDDMVVGPPLPEYFGNAWKMNINSYQVMLNGATHATKAFTKDQIDNFKSSEEAVDEAVKQYHRLTGAIAFYSSALITAKGAQKEQMLGLKENAELEQKMYAQIITDYNAWNKVNRPTGGSSYKQDPLINIMQERIKFMKDFKKGYDDLNKYLSSTDALSKTADKLRTRGLSLGIEAAEQQKAAKGLSQWYGDTIETVYAEVQKKYKITGPVESFLSQQIKDTTNRGKALRDFQKLLQSLFDEKTDLDVSELKKSLENELKKVQDEIKHSETARNFYNDILDLTGEENLAASISVSVYGGIGQEFRERMQAQLNAALKALDAGSLTDELRTAFAEQNFKVILDNLDKFPEKWQETLKQMAADSEKFNANRAQQLLKDLQKAKTYSEKRIELAERTARRQEEIEAMSISDAAKRTLSDRNAKKEAEDLASLQYEAFKNTPMYVEMFADLDAASADMLSHMRGQLEQMKSNWKDLHPRELKELQSRLNELDSQLASRNPFKALYTSVKNYIEMVREMPRGTAEGASIYWDSRTASEKELLDEYTKEYEAARDLYGENHEITQDAKERMQVQADIVTATEEQAENAQDSAVSYRQAAKAILDAAEGMKKWNGYLTESLDAVGEIVHVFSSDDFSDTFDTISDGIGKTAGGLVSTAAGIGKIMAGDVSGIVDVLKGISDVVTGIFGTAQELNLKRIDKELKKQDDLLEDLSYSYDRLGEAMERAFGSDYIYNYTKQLENLNAQLEAYNKQADLEREKGKKADADKIKEYENNARDAQKAIEDMNGQLAEFFSGTDLTSAAQDFANSWIEAYKEFGSTTDAMKEKFQEMIQNMVTQSLGAKIMQTILQPLFDEIDEMARSGGELSAAEIAELATSTPEYIARINDAMTTMMSQLTAAGYNMRQQPGGFTGISRNIAGASEESINGLAAGINTQNFYMSLISQNVAAILATMTGEQVEGATGAAAVPDTYKEQMLVYAGSLPQMRDDMASIRAMLSQVIKPRGVQASHYVATNL